MSDKQPYQELIGPDGRVIGAKEPLWRRFMLQLGVAGVIGVLAYAVMQIYAGYLGMAYFWGGGWGFAAVVLCLMFRMSLPITLGAFFGALHVWGWHWILALVFTVPGVAFFVAVVAKEFVFGVVLKKVFSGRG